MFTIQVEERHIQESRRRLKEEHHTVMEPKEDDEYAYHCPIAIAAQEKFPLRRIRVTSTAMVFDNATSIHNYWSLPFPARYFVSHFDAGNHVFPFTFKIGGSPNVQLSRIRQI